MTAEEHLPGCRILLVDYQEEETLVTPEEHRRDYPDMIGIEMCAEGCPVLARVLARARRCRRRPRLALALPFTHDLWYDGSAPEEAGATTEEASS
jgi:hypothetical protein